jgi:hypothetical protein
VSLLQISQFYFNYQVSRNKDNPDEEIKITIILQIFIANVLNNSDKTDIYNEFFKMITTIIKNGYE